jgi:TPR repeat protein
LCAPAGTIGRAAEQGLSEAQYNIGVIYASGVGVPQDYIKTYAWLILAYSNGYEQAKDDILISNKAMTASEMEKAEEETAKLREKLIK